MSLWRRFRMLTIWNKVGVVGSIASVAAVPLTFLLTSDPYVSLVVAGFGFASWWLLARLIYRLHRLRSFEGMPDQHQLRRLFAEYGPVPATISAAEWRGSRRDMFVLCGILVLLGLLFLGWIGLLVSRYFEHKNDSTHAEERGTLTAQWAAEAGKSSDLREQLSRTQVRLEQVLQRDRVLHVATATLAGRADLMARYRPSPEVNELAADLNGLVKQFEVSTPQPLNVDDDRLVRLAKATIEVAAERFANADRLLRDEDATAERQRTEQQIDRESRIVAMRAETTYGLRQWAAALRHYERLLEIDRHNLTARLGKGKCLNQLGRFRESAQYWDDLLAVLDAAYKHQEDRDLGRTIAAVLSNRASAMAGLGEFDGSRRDLEAAINMMSLVEKRAGPNVGLCEDLAKSRMRVGAIWADGRERVRPRHSAVRAIDQGERYTGVPVAPGRRLSRPRRLAKWGRAEEGVSSGPGSRTRDRG